MFCYAFAVDKQKANIGKNNEENAVGLLYMYVYTSVINDL